jgi:hypothetical protein
VWKTPVEKTCFLLAVVQGKETNANLKHFGQYFKEIDKIEYLPTLMNIGYKKISMRHKSDMLAHWKLTGNGEVANIKCFPCMWCPAKSATMHVP